MTDNGTNSGPAGGPQPVISVLLPIKNEQCNIGRCLDAVFAQRECPSFEVVAVDSGSTDGTLETLAAYPVRVHRIPSEEFHHARTRNLLASLARGDSLIFLNGDAFPASSHWLRELVAPLADPKVAAVYGRQLLKPDAGLERQYTLPLLYGDQPIRKDPASKRSLGYRYYQFSTVNCAIRRRTWEELRFPEELTYSEDVGIAKRILDQGLTIMYHPAAAVYHSHNYSAQVLLRRYFDTAVTYRRLGVWNEAGTHASLRSDGWKVFRAGLHAAVRAPRHGARTLARDAAKAGGFWLGKHENLLPHRLKRRLTLFGLF